MRSRATANVGSACTKGKTTDVAGQASAGGLSPRQENPDGSAGQLRRVSPGRQALQSASQVADLPWVDSRQQATRKQVDGRMQELIGCLDLGGRLRDQFGIALGMVHSFEVKVRFVDKVVNTLNVVPFDPEMWRQLCGEMQSLAEDEVEVGHMTLNLSATKEVSKSNRKALKKALADLLKRMRDAREYLHSQQVRLDDRIRPISLELPGRAPGQATVNSGVTPVGMQTAHVTACDVNESVVCGQQAVRNNEVPEFERTVLTGSDGRTLFTGLRHSFLDAGAVPAVDRPGLPMTEPAKGRPVLTARQLESWLAGGEVDARVLALLTAAATGDPAKRQCAQAGKPITVQLSAVSMLMPEDTQAWLEQWLAMTKVQREGPLLLSVLGKDREIVRVPLHFEFRFFPISASAARILPPGMIVEQIEQLLGPLQVPELGGAVKLKAEASEAEAYALFTEMVCIARGMPRGLADCGQDVEGQDATQRLAGVKVTWNKLKDDSRALLEAGQQLKDLWMERQSWPDDRQGCVDVAARLALIAWLMQEVPVLSCANGTDGNRQLDPAIKFLASAVGCMDGQVPPPADPGAEAWKPLRQQFRPQ